VGDVTINIMGTIESMPFFLLGHLAYVRSFARGCDVSKRRFLQFEWPKKLALICAFFYAFSAFLLMESAFDGIPLKLVLFSYILALSLMFGISLFSRSQLVVTGSALYLLSDSLIGFAAFVFKGNLLAQMLDFYAAFPIYYVGKEKMARF
jgi:hypothetical protein